MKHIFLSVVIPAYNEATNIRLGALDKVARYLERQSYAWEVLVVNDGSTDETRELLDEYARTNPGFSIIHYPHKGKAGSVIAGMLAARGEIILFSDLDQATPIREVEKLLPWFEKGPGFDVVIGSRSSNRAGAPFTRLIMARGFMLLRSLLLGLHGIIDTQCGFKAFRKDVAHDIFHRLRLYSDIQAASGATVSAGFDVEVLFLAKKLGFSIKEVPVDWHYVETRRVNPIRDSWQGLIDIIKIRLASMRGLY